MLFIYGMLVEVKIASFEVQLAYSKFGYIVQLSQIQSCL